MNAINERPNPIGFVIHIYVAASLLLSFFFCPFFVVIPYVDCVSILVLVPVKDHVIRVSFIACE